MSGLPEVPLRGILEAYQAMHPSIKGRAYWLIGLEHWQAIRVDRRCMNLVIDRVDITRPTLFLGLPVIFVPDESVVLAIGMSERAAS